MSAPNLNLRLFKFDKEKLISECTLLHSIITKLQISGEYAEKFNEENCDENTKLLQSEFEYLYDALPKTFDKIIKSDNMKIEFITEMIDDLFSLQHNKDPNYIKNIINKHSNRAYDTYVRGKYTDKSNEDEQ